MTPPARHRAEPLNREEVVEAALALTRTVGVGGLTMRKLAASLGVSPMAAYHYVADKDDLLRLVTEEVTARFPRLEPGEEPWDDVLRRHLLLAWETFRQYPGLHLHLADRPGIGVTRAGLDRGVEFFRRAGFGPAEAVLAWSLAETYLLGRMNVDSRLHDSPDGLRTGALRARDYVEFGVDTLIDGLRARLARTS
jgi:TetR/AcrR family tetracycline transcriptional repressor